MATTDIPTSTQSDQASKVPVADDEQLTPFERIVARMKGTGRIVGDIVSPDPELWDCEID